MFNIPDCDITKQHREDFMRQYMASHLSIKTTRYIKMRTTIDNEMEYYCCTKCKDTLKIIFQPIEDQYVLKQYTVGSSECVLKDEEKILNYYLNLIEIYYPTIKKFINNHQLYNMSANKVLKLYSEKVLDSKLTFIDLIENVSHVVKSKISKKWSNLITKYRREENVKFQNDTKTTHPPKTNLDNLILKKLSNAKAPKTPKQEQETIYIPNNIEFKQHSQNQQKNIVVFAPYEIKQEQEDIGDMDIDLNGFNNNWEEPQETLKVRVMNIDESLPKYLGNKNSSLVMPDVLNPSYQSVCFNQKI